MAAPSKFTPVQRGPVPPPPQGNSSEGSFPVVPVFLFIIYVVYLGVAIIAPLFVEGLSDSLDSMVPPLIRVIIAAVLFALFAAIIVYMIFLSGDGAKQAGRPPLPPPPPPRTAPATGGPGPGRFTPVTQPGGAPASKPAATPTKPEKRPEPKPVEKKEEKPIMIAYPLEVEGGIFGDTYIRLSERKVLKLRSMIVEPEHLA